MLEIFEILKLIKEYNPINVAVYPYDRKLYIDNFEEFNSLKDFPNKMVTKNNIFFIFGSYIKFIFKHNVKLINEKLRYYDIEKSLNILKNHQDEYYYKIWDGYNINEKEIEKLKEFKKLLNENELISYVFKRKQILLITSIDNILKIIRDKNYYEYNDIDDNPEVESYDDNGMPLDVIYTYYYTFMPNCIDISRKEKIKRIKKVYSLQKDFCNRFNDFHNYAKKRVY